MAETKKKEEEKAPEAKVEYTEAQINDMVAGLKASMAEIPEAVQKKVMRKAGVAKTGSIAGAIFSGGTAHGVYEHLRAEGGNNTTQAVVTAAVTGVAGWKLTELAIKGVKTVVEALRN